MSEKKSGEPTEDQELNDLLDSALKDFKEESTTEEEKKKTDETNTSEPLPEKKAAERLDDAWTRDFLKQAADQFEENLQNLMQNGTEADLGASFQKMAQTVANAITESEGLDTESANTDFQSAITRALNDLDVTSENLQNDTDLSEMFGQASLEDGPGMILPFMQEMLQHLLSKEILHPSLKELVQKFPDWLEQKKSTLSATDYNRYTKQLELMKKVCEELEKETGEDSEAVKKRRFEAIVSLMQEVQNCGQLPEELVGEQSMPFQLDADGDPVVPALLRGMDSPQNCCLM